MKGRNKSRFLSILLTISMILSLVTPFSYAVEYNYSDPRLTGITDGDETTLPRYVLELFSEDENGDLVKTTAKAIRDNANDEEAENEVFYLGIKAENFDKFTAMPLYGLSNLTIQFSYDTTYFQVEPDPVGYEYVDAESIKPRVKSYASANGIQTLLNAGGQKPSAQSNNARAYTFEASESIIDTTNYVTLILKPSNLTYMGSMTSEEYISFIAFKVLDTPETGIDSFTLGRSFDSNTLSLGSSTNQVALAYNAESALETMLVLDESQVNIFPNMYDVTFYNDSTLGTAVGTAQSVEENGTVSADSIPTKDLFTAPDNTQFYTGLKYTTGDNTADPTTDPDFTSATAITANTKVYAVYETGYEVTFNPGTYPGAEAPEETSIYIDKNGDSFNIPAESVPTWTAEGYALTGWKNGGEDVDLETYEVSGNVTLTAQWTQEVTVNFNYNYVDAPDVVYQTVSVKPGDALGANAPENKPERTDYTFVEWNTEKNGSGNSYIHEDLATAVFNENEELYAIWTYEGDDKLKIEFDAVGGTLNPTDGVIYVKPGDDVPEYYFPTATKDSYEFAGWYENATLSDTTRIQSYTALAEDKKLYAHWTYNGAPENAAVVTFDSQGATTETSPSTVTIKQGESIGAAMPNPPEMNEKTFGGWYTAPNGGGDVFTAETTVNQSALTVYANWIDNITVTFDVNGGTSEAPAPQTEAASATFRTPTEPTKTDYTFVGWNTERNGSGTYIEDNTKTYAEISALKDNATNVTLYAIWTYEGADKLKVEFDAVGGTLNPTDGVIYVKPGDDVPEAYFPTATKDSYEFAGWYENATLSDTTKIQSYTALAEDKKLYAHWTYSGDSANQAVVTFDSQDATVATSPSTVTIKQGESIGAAMPNPPTKDGKTFGGWYTEANGAGTEFTAETTVNESALTVYANWIDNITVTFDVNGGTSEAPAFQTEAANVTFRTPAEPTKTDYTFVGWNTERNGSGTYIEDNTKTYAEISAEQDNATDVILYAQWATVPASDIGDVKGNTPVEPEENGVRIEFDKNVGTNANGSSVTINPMYKYVRLGDSIGISAEASNLPSVSEREGYTFKEWNTKANGDGTKVDETTPITEDLGVNDEVLSLYAIWEASPADESQKATVVYMTNTSSTDETEYDRQTVVVNDSVVALPDDPTNGTYVFKGWNTARDGSGDDFDENTAVSANPTTIYAQWQKLLSIEIVNNNSKYTGNPIPAVLDIYEVSADEEGAIIPESKVLLFDDYVAGSDDKFTVSYETDPNAPTNVGTYALDVTATGIAGSEGMQVEYFDNNTYTIDPADVEITVTNQQVKKATAGSVQEYLNVASDPNQAVTVTYRKWEDANEDGVIADTELASADPAPTTEGQYVAIVTITDTNYMVSSVVGNTYSNEVYADAPIGQNIMFEILPSNPAIGSVVVNSVKGETVSADPLKLTSDNYTSEVTFDTAEEPTLTDYYVRVTDTDADSVQFTITAVDPATVITCGTDGATVTKNDDGTYTVKAPLTNKGATANDIVITSTIGSGANAPSNDYTFHVQGLMSPSIKLEYGNSPYGMIMKQEGWSDTIKTQAITAFNADNKFTTSYLPTGGSTLVKYTLDAWGNSEDPTVNMDRDPYAIFGYEKEAFSDTGFTVKDALGNDVSATVKRTITVTRLTAYDINEVVTDANNETITIDANTGDSLAAITESSKGLVRPDVYEMTYTYHDETLDEDVSVGTRNIIILPALGDIDMQDGVNNNDTVPIVSQVQKLGNIVNTAVVGESISSLFYYRVCDTDMQDGVNNNDTVPIVSKVQKMGEIVDFYKFIAE